MQHEGSLSHQIMKKQFLFAVKEGRRTIIGSLVLIAILTYFFNLIGFEATHINLWAATTVFIILYRWHFISRALQEIKENEEKVNYRQ